MLAVGWMAWLCILVCWLLDEWLDLVGWQIGTLAIGWIAWLGWLLGWQTGMLAIGWTAWLGWLFGWRVGTLDIESLVWLGWLLGWQICMLTTGWTAWLGWLFGWQTGTLDIEWVAWLGWLFGWQNGTLAIGWLIIIAVKRMLFFCVLYLHTGTHSPLQSRELRIKTSKVAWQTDFLFQWVPIRQAEGVKRSINMCTCIPVSSAQQYKPLIE